MPTREKVIQDTVNKMREKVLPKDKAIERLQAMDGDAFERFSRDLFRREGLAAETTSPEHINDRKVDVVVVDRLHSDARRVFLSQEKCMKSGVSSHTVSKYHWCSVKHWIAS